MEACSSINGRRRSVEERDRRGGDRQTLISSRSGWTTDYCSARLQQQPGGRRKRPEGPETLSGKGGKRGKKRSNNSGMGVNLLCENDLPRLQCLLNAMAF